MKRQLLTIALLLTPISALLAQENKHAQAMHTAFVETINGKFPKNIKAKLESMNEDSATVAHGEWGCLDGGGLVPREKIHVVTLSKSKSNVTAAVGPLYIDGHRFEFERVPDDPLLPLRPILDAFDKQAPYANSYYSYKAGDEQAVFPGVSIAWGSDGQVFNLNLDPQMNIRIMGFKDDDGFRSTYLLAWMNVELDDADTKHPLYNVGGIIYEFHCPKMESTPQVKSYDSQEYLDRTNTGMSVAHKLVRDLQKTDPQRAAVLETDTLEEVYLYSFQKMTQKLYEKPDTPIPNTGYDALIAKVRRMAELSRTANPTEMEAICHTLVKELNAYPFLLSHRHVSEVSSLIDQIAATVPDEMRQQVTSARTLLNVHENQTVEIDSLSENEQEYLNRNHWKVSHGPMNYQNDVFFSLSEFASNGAHYSGDKYTGYLDVQYENYQGFQAETTLQGLRPGRYRLSAVVRADKADHSGIYIFCESGSGIDTELYQKEIPGDGDTGGNVWFSALCRLERRAAGNEGVAGLDINKASANGGLGFGWNRIYIDDIVVKDGTLTYGISTCPEITNSHQFESRWFSACDFIVERIGD